MSLFSKQKLICCICGKPFSTTADKIFWNHGSCSNKCLKEKNWREVLSILGKEYYSESENDGK